MTYLNDTDSGAIAREFVRARTNAGSPVMGMVMTLVVVVDADAADQAISVVRAAIKAHPARVLVTVLGDGRGRPRVDAEVSTGAGWSGESAIMRLYGPAVKHPDSVLTALLLPDCPVCVWWPEQAPDNPAADVVGRLADRRITDVSANQRRRGAMRKQCLNNVPGNTDLAWTRLTPWRSLLASALDQHPDRVTSAVVSAGRLSASGDLLKAWLSDRLTVPVQRRVGDDDRLSWVRLRTASGDIEVRRVDDHSGIQTFPNAPDRMVSLPRHDTAGLLTEELSHLAPDPVYDATARRLIELKG